MDVTFSTAQPQLNATPPELLAFDVTVVSRGEVNRGVSAGQRGQGGSMGQMMGGAGFANSDGRSSGPAT